MPKAAMPIPGTRKMKTVKVKFKIGNRKSNIAGLGLHTEILLDKFETPYQNRDKQQIQQILTRRGLDVNVLITERKDRIAAEEAAQAA